MTRVRMTVARIATFGPAGNARSDGRRASRPSRGTTARRTLRVFGGGADEVVWAAGAIAFVRFGGEVLVEDADDRGIVFGQAAVDRLRSQHTRFNLVGRQVAHLDCA